MRFFPLAALVAALCSASPAFARSNYPQMLPNGAMFGCQSCHPGGATNQLTGFGTDSSTRIAGGRVNWPQLFALDSDGDGQTNGEELGDPCGVWTAGATPGRTNDLSNPGVAASKAANPRVPACGAPDAGFVDTGGAADTGVRRDAGAREDAGEVELEESGCSCRTSGRANAGGEIAVVLLFALLLRRKRRRGLLHHDRAGRSVEQENAEPSDRSRTNFFAP